MFMTQTEVQAVQNYAAESAYRIGLGSMMDSIDREQYRDLREIAQLAVRNTRKRESELYNLWLEMSEEGKAAFEADVQSGEFFKRMNYVDFWHPIMKNLK
jgi:hypothetical protein